MSSVLRRPLAAVGFLSLVALGSLSLSGVASAHVTSAHHMRAATVIQPGGTLRGAKSNSPVELSLNWSGYAVTSSTRFNFVHTEFVQPSITCTGQQFTDQSQWVGLDGFTSDTVEQDGTNAYCGGPDHMTPRYTAWYEMFPAASVNVFVVHPGDVIDAQVTFKHGMFTTTISDVTTGKTSGTSAACHECERSSAEWIVERPVFCANKACDKGVLARLAHFTRATFNVATAGVDGSSATAINSFTHSPIDMYTPGKPDKLLDMTSTLSQKGHAFADTWQRLGKPLLITF